jgi:hypothetical protein
MHLSSKLFDVERQYGLIGRELDLLMGVLVLGVTLRILPRLKV